MTIYNFINSDSAARAAGVDPPKEVAEVPQAKDELNPPGFMRLSSTATSTYQFDKH